MFQGPLSLLCAFAFLLPTVALSQPYGIDSRAANDSLVITELPADVPGTMELVRAFPRLVFSFPVLMIESPETPPRMFVVEKRGTIRVFPKVPDPAPGQAATFLDIQAQVLDSGEQGFLGLAFDPEYATNGEFYVYYSWLDGECTTCPTRVSRFTNDDPADNAVDLNSEEVIIEFDQPYGNHNGGMIAFGPDGMLYIGLGDGGSGGDPLNNGQDTRTLLGSILRIDVRSAPDPGLAYHVPEDNPFFDGGPAGEDTRKEIYAYGLRNPWRFSFDMQIGTLFCGDVGQNSYEEVDVIVAGGNYGWRYREGAHCYNPPTGCPTEGLIDPIIEYGRELGRSITGGYVSYATDVPELYGMYLYADYVSRRIWGLRYEDVSVSGPFTLVAAAPFAIAGFGQDGDGEAYVLSFSGTGGAYALRPQETPAPSEFPLQLSDIPALLAAGAGIDQTTGGIIPYEPSAKLWSDGSLKERYLALPGLDQMGYRNAGGWDFDEHALIVKNFLLPLDEADPVGSAKRIETRLLLKKDGQWHGFSYEWNEDETDAQLLSAGKQRTFTILDQQGQPFSYTWQYPSRGQCLQCHTDAANGVLGLNTPQMNLDFTYPASGETDNQLRTYDHIQLFAAALPDTPDNLPRMPDPSDASAPLAARARAYLAANCSMCHQPGGPAPTTLDLRWETANEDMNAIGVPPGNGDLGIVNPRVIAPGAPNRSVLLRRMNLRDGSFQMPPLATSRIDKEAVALIDAWIASLPSGATVLSVY